MPINIGSIFGQYLARPNFDDSVARDITQRFEPYQDYFLLVEKNDVLMEGVAALRRNADKYLPTFIEPGTRKYEVFLQEAVLDNTYTSAIRDSAGRIFTKDVAVSDDVPSFYDDWRKNVDRKETTFNRFAHRALYEMLQYGISYVLVDASREAGDGTLPYLTNIKATQLLRLTYQNVDGIDILTRFVWKVNDNEIRDYRLEDGRAKLYIWTSATASQGNATISGTAFFSIADERETDFDMIPIFPIYAERHSFFFGIPPLKFLADKALDISRRETLINLQFNYTLNPFLHLAGDSLGKDTEDKKLDISIDLAMITDSDTAANWIQADDKMVRAAMDRVTEMKKEVQDFTVNFIGRKPTALTATEVEADNARERTRLRNIVENLQYGFNNVMRFVSDIIRQDWPDDGIAFNQELEIAVATSEHVNTLIALRQQNLITTELLLDQLNQMNVFVGNVDIEDVIAALPADNERGTPDDERTQT